MLWTVISQWVYLILGLLLLSGCATKEQEFKQQMEAVEKIAPVLENNGVELDAQLISDGAGLIIDNRYMLSAGNLQVNLKTNPLAPILYKQMEYNHMTMMEIMKYAQMPVPAVVSTTKSTDDGLSVTVTKKADGE